MRARRYLSTAWFSSLSIVAIKVSAGYSSSKGAYVNCDNPFNGNTETNGTPKNCALVLLAEDGTYPLVLTTAYFNQKFSNGNALNPGVKAGLYTREGNFNNYYYKFVNENSKLGFERNSDNKNEVTLATKDEVYLSVSSKDDNFFGKWDWKGNDKWIEWTGKTYADYPTTSDAIQTLNRESFTVNRYFDLQGRQISLPTKGLYINNGKKYIAK